MGHLISLNLYIDNVEKEDAEKIANLLTDGGGMLTDAIVPEYNEDGKRMEFGFGYREEIHEVSMMQGIEDFGDAVYAETKHILRGSYIHSGEFIEKVEVVSSFTNSECLEDLFRHSNETLRTVSSELSRRPENMARALVNMDRVVRMINDEENGIFETWITEFVADGDGYDELLDYADLPEMYLRASTYFARNVARLITEGEFSADGWTLELFNSSAVCRAGKKATLSGNQKLESAETPEVPDVTQ